MIIFRKRLIFWLLKAYLKKSKKIILFSFLAGLFIFSGLYFGSSTLTKIIPVSKKETIGMVGAYDVNHLPPIVMSKIGRGLTKIEEDGTIKPDVAEKWIVKDDGKTYIFTLKKDIKFTDGKILNSNDINYNFTDVAVEKPDMDTLVFKLKNSYAPFLSTVSSPIFKNGYVGVGEYSIDDVDLNGNFVQSIQVSSSKNRFNVIRYQFYPSDEALKMAYLLGEIDTAKGLTNSTFKEYNFSDFSRTDVTTKINNSKLITVFYNTSDPVLSDKKVRLALDYSLPNKFENGERVYQSYPKTSHFYNQEITGRIQDFEHAMLLLEDSSASGSARTVNLKTLPKYKNLAEKISEYWKKAGVITKIEEVDQVPTSFQIFLGDFNLPKDPDQYTLWHSGQINNITKYKNLRIDKLLEDGRKTANQNERRSVYTDFQRYLWEDVPASFLYFPYEYEIKRG